MADGYLERRREEYERRKAEWLRKKRRAPRPKRHTPKPRGDDGHSPTHIKGMDESLSD